MSPQKPWLQQLWDAGNPSSTAVALEGSVPSPKVKNTPATRKDTPRGIDWHGGTVDGYYTGYDEDMQAAWRVPYNKPSASRETSSKITNMHGGMWCTWNDGFQADISADLSP
ncbi:hypothetical protein N9L68_05090 [bacterium]|nr:hypothetical protein [bacterium]